ncbi:MAG: sulfate adenylyltransferase [Candidatus Marinimicrobia bacterium]|jgi:pyruvate kinase|nr:sulfate adenylyltransferase [Candidatus Neomarinimicrobiota bacterium]
MKKRKIIVTLGPSSLTKQVVKKMDILGVDIFRINLSHVEINEFEKTIKMVKEWTDKPVCPDSEGAQLRTGNINGNNIHLVTGSTISFIDLSGNKDKAVIPLNVQNPGELLSLGDLLRIDFNSVIVQISEVDGINMLARVIKGGEVGSNKGISVDRPIIMPRFTNKDISAFKISKKLGLDTFFLSFCSSGEDVRALRKLFDYPIKVISKIESNRGLNNLSSICKESDGILIDRGDLSRDVPLTKIAFAQSYILDTAKRLDVPAFVATNLIESMVEKSEPNRAEINDIVQTLESGADGLVLAAESAIGKYPTECVKVISSLIKEVDTKPAQVDLEYLLNPPSDNIIPPHGGQFVEQIIPYEKGLQIDILPIIKVNQRVESDVIQITNGAYSPLDRFMNQDELDSVLDKNELLDGTVWPMPILFQLDEQQKKESINNGQLALKSERTGKVFAVIEVEKIEEIKDLNKTARNWFGTESSKHPGVDQFFNSGSFILSGKPFLIESRTPASFPHYELTPNQTRKLFSLYGWTNIIGYHTRNVPHRGHEFIQRKALEETGSDGILISPVTGIKKKGDFSALAIIRCFEKLIEDGFYDPFGVLISSFNTYSRYSGPKEAVFTAICRKNYGCSHFIVGRDHTGVGNYYANDASQKIFDELDIGMKILKFGKASYCSKRKIITDDFQSNNFDNSMVEISGSRVRYLFQNRENVPDYLLRSSLLKELNMMMSNNLNDVFEEAK